MQSLVIQRFARVGAQKLYRSPISDAMNVRFVENHIVIERPVKAVYDWVTTWSNLPKWLPVAHRVEVLKGQHRRRALEQINVDIAALPVIARIPGCLWTVAGQDAPGGLPMVAFPDSLPSLRKRWGRTYFILSAIPERCRQGDVSIERHIVENPHVIQSSLESIKDAIETDRQDPERDTG